MKKTDPGKFRNLFLKIALQLSCSEGRLRESEEWVW